MLLKVVILLTFLLISLFACSGDCKSCHPKLDLNGDTRHSIMKNCINCHTEDSFINIDMGAACGQDCWACHDVKKVSKLQIIEHKELERCIACHTGLDKKLDSNFEFGKPKGVMESLR